ncbi:type II secretion system F family protein [Halopenitus persicus]|uniref:Type II secretion system (T2SS), protein F n=1 Tax=Halopenitus persicus TaxID=1048396 RepID=A0A1H3IGX3_9EURY|nr:type II secretion system F family protein [Halopenitus persicus]SDY26519.1 Type II secretion system (T2SS), protein F [Halopenitus persicus]
MSDGRSVASTATGAGSEPERGDREETVTRGTDRAGPHRSAVGTGSRFSAVDRGLHALFARHADAARHARDRDRYRATAIRTGFDVLLARMYGLSWAIGVVVAVPVVLLGRGLSPALLARLDAALAAGLPTDGVGLARLPPEWIVLAAAVLAGAVAKRGVVRGGGVYLRWIATARRTDIERTLPGAVRYLHALSSGSDTARGMIRKTAANEAYGETAVAFRAALNSARLTGSLDQALGRVARDTPSNDLLAPFLLKFREHANQGEDALGNYLAMEGRMLGHREDRARKRAEGFLELLSELFIVLLVLPTLLVIVLTVIGVIAPGLSEPVHTPVGSISTRAAIVYGSAAFILVVGLASSTMVERLRPPDQRTRYELPTGVAALCRSVTVNPRSAAAVVAGPAVVACVGLANAGVDPVNAVALGYVLFAVPTGIVSVRRARLDDAKDREIKDFVHAVSGHVSLGRPFPEAVALVARDVDLGALDADVADLAFNLSLTTGNERAARNVLDRSTNVDVETDGNAATGTERVAGAEAGTERIAGAEAERKTVRTAALNRFVENVGTPLAEQTVGLITGALDAGSDTQTVFETLQTEIGRLYHQKRALRSAMLVYVAVGWTAALLVIGIVVAVNLHVIDGFAQLSAVSGASAVRFDPGTIRPERERYRFYVVLQATMLASGWFAGVASRGWYEALLHSGILVGVCYVVFAGVGLL